jgi:hypothetical protein
MQNEKGARAEQSWMAKRISLFFERAKGGYITQEVNRVCVHV